MRLSLAICAVALSAAGVGSQQPARIPSPNEHIGIKVGADRTLADWGQITGYFQKPMTEAEFVQTLVSPTKAECMKRLQANQLVLLCVQTSPQDPVPQGVKEFQADPHFGQRTQVLTVQLRDPSEASFFAHLQIDPQSSAPVTVFMAPPGVLVGRFAPSASKAQLSEALHKAGKHQESVDTLAKAMKILNIK